MADQALGRHEGDQFGMGDGTTGAGHQVDSRSQQPAAVEIEYGGAERPAAVMLDVGRRQPDGQLHALFDAVEHMLCRRQQRPQPTGQGQLHLGPGHGSVRGGRARMPCCSSHSSVQRGL
jgi:hypothetical protein